MRAMSRPQRLHGFSYRGRYSYFLTFCTFQRLKVFSDHRLGELVENPTRAGLVTTVAEYALVGSDEWSLEEILHAV
jgi:hypothetical protein